MSCAFLLPAPWLFELSNLVVYPSRQSLSLLLCVRASPYFSSTGIVAGAVMVKLPQIQRILSKGSVEGLRFQMFAAEVISGTVAIAYFTGQGMALAAYAELFFILAQNLIILALMGFYGGKGNKGSGLAELLPAAVLYGVVTFALAAGVIPQQYLELGYNASTFMLIYGAKKKLSAASTFFSLSHRQMEVVGPHRSRPPALTCPAAGVCFCIASRARTLRFDRLVCHSRRSLRRDGDVVIAFLFPSFSRLFYLLRSCRSRPSDRRQLCCEEHRGAEPDDAGAHERGERGEDLHHRAGGRQLQHDWSLLGEGSGEEGKNAPRAVVKLNL